MPEARGGGDVSTDEEITSVRAALAQTESAINAAYWAFTRTKRGGPVPSMLYEQRAELKRKLRELECAK